MLIVIAELVILVVREDRRNGIDLVDLVFLAVSKTDSLSSVLANFYDDLKVTTKEHLFSGKASMFLDIAKHPNNDEYKLIETIARAIFNLRMSDFTDEIMSCYVHDLKAVVDEIKSYDEKLANSRNSANGYKIIFTDENGHEMAWQFLTQSSNTRIYALPFLLTQAMMRSASVMNPTPVSLLLPNRLFLETE